MPPSFFWFAILMTIGQASAMAAPSCSMDLFGWWAVGGIVKITHLPDPSSSQSCFQACSQKLDSWGSSDWYWDSEDPTTKEYLSDASLCAVGEDTKKNGQAKPRRLMMAEWYVSNSNKHHCGNNWDEGSCNACGCWCIWESSGQWDYSYSEPGSTIMGASQAVCDMMSSAKKKGDAISDSCDPGKCRTPDGQGGFDCWADGDREPFACAEAGLHVVETGTIRIQGDHEEKEFTCCDGYNLHQLSRMAENPTVLPATVHDHALQLESLTSQLKAMTKRVEDLEARTNRTGSSTGCRQSPLWALATLAALGVMAI